MNDRFDAFLSRLQSYGDRDCLFCDSSSFSYADLNHAIEQVGSQLDSLRIERHGVVALRADYSLGAVAALFALLAAKHVVAMLPRDRDPDSLLPDCHALGLLDMDLQGAWTWRSLPTASVRHPLLTAPEATNDAGLVLFTSGTTGKPKAALQSLERFLSKFETPGKSLRTLAFLLFDHVAGLDTLFYTLANGGTVVVTRYRSPAGICRLIEEARVEVLSASPTFLRLLCMSDDSRVRDLSSLKIITYGSEPMDPHTLALLNNRFPGCRISQKYGTTETGSPRSISRDNNSLWLKLDSDGVEVKVVDEMLYIRSESTILGYLNAPSPVDADGWYCTGDLVDVDGQWIRFRGRSDDRINVGGEKVSPSQVEQVLLELDLVGEAAAYGVPNAMMGEVVGVMVVLTEQIEERDAVRRIRIHCRSRLAPHMVPTHIRCVSGSLSSARHKVQRTRRS